MKTRVKYETGLDKFNQIGHTTNFLFNLIFILLCLVCVVPVLFVIAISITSETALQDFGYQLIPKAFSVESYVFLLRQWDVITRALGVSVFVTVVGTIIGVLLTTTMGYVISRPQFKLKKSFTMIVFIPMVFNGGMIATYYVNANMLGLKDSIWALILPLAVSSFNVVICKTFFQSTIPDSLVEAGKIDGASQLTIFFRIVLPISLPVLATIGLFLCFTYWNDWFQSMLYINNVKLNSLQALLTKIMDNVDYLSRNATLVGVSSAEMIRTMPKEGARMAIATLIVIPIACAYPFFQKYFISGLTVGSVKG